MANQEELNRYMIMIEQYKEQLNSLENQTAYINAIINDYNKAKLTLQQIKDSDKNMDVLLPIGGGAFIDAIAKNPSNVLIDVGAGVVLEKSSEEAVKKIESRINNLTKTQDQISEMIDRLQQEASQVSQKAQQLLSEQRNE